MKRKLIFFVNPISGIQAKGALKEKISSKCKSKAAEFEILLTSKDGDYRFLPKKISKEQITDVVICGGDGSISPIVAELLHRDINIGIIPLGSGNGLARTVGIPKDTERALEVIFSGSPVYADVFKINNRIGCQIAGFGFDALVAAEFAKERSRGLSTYTKLALKNFLRARAYSFSLIREGKEPLNVSAFILCISNANQFGNNIRIAPHASINDGLLDVVILKKTRKLHVLPVFVNHLFFPKKTPDISLNLKREKILYFNCKKIIVENNDLAPVHIGRRPVESTLRFEIEIIPSAYKLILPA